MHACGCVPNLSAEATTCPRCLPASCLCKRNLHTQILYRTLRYLKTFVVALSHPFAQGLQELLVHTTRGHVFFSQETQGFCSL
jgi:hypothetical protein